MGVHEVHKVYVRGVGCCMDIVVRYLPQELPFHLCFPTISTPAEIYLWISLSPSSTENFPEPYMKLHLLWPKVIEALEDTIYYCGWR